MSKPAFNDDNAMVNRLFLFWLASNTINPILLFWLVMVNEPLVHGLNHLFSQVTGAFGGPGSHMLVGRPGVTRCLAMAMLPPPRHVFIEDGWGLVL